MAGPYDSATTAALTGFSPTGISVSTVVACRDLLFAIQPELECWSPICWCRPSQEDIEIREADS